MKTRMQLSKPPLERQISVRIQPLEDGCTILDFLCQRFTYQNRGQWLQDLQDGRLTLTNNATPLPDTTLIAGDKLTYRAPVLIEPPVNFNCTVIHQDSDLIVVNKPGQLPCHPGGRYFRHTLWGLLKERFGLEKPSIINRLDRETSGLVLIAKHGAAARSCCEQFAAHQVQKRYFVLVEGIFPFKEIVADGFLLPDQHSVVRKKVRFVSLDSDTGLTTKATACSTGFKFLKSSNHISLLEARPISGRCHQIRATLHSLGFPVVGDKVYGVDEQLFIRFIEQRLSPLDKAMLRLDRQALHCSSLELRHPADGRQMAFFAPMPNEFIF